MKSPNLPASAVQFSPLGARAQPPTIARLMSMALETPGLLSLAAGFTDNATLPTSAVQAAVDALAARDGQPEFLQYGTNRGRPRLRQLLTDRLCGLEPMLERSDVEKGFFITNGSQQALYLAMQVLCEPGDIVLVDRPSYFVFLEMLTGLGVEARSIPTTSSGEVDGTALRALLAAMVATGASERIKAVYFVSYFSNPSSRSLNEEEKTAIAEALTAHGLCPPVIEDAAYRELYYREPEAARSVLSLPAWEGFPRLYLSTLTKPFATGLKVGYGTCTDAAWLSRMLHVKGHHDFGTANFNQAVFEHVLGTESFDEHLSTLRPAYERKMHALHSRLIEGGLQTLGWQWCEPRGGLYLWLRAPDGFATGLDSDFCHACVRAGVLYVPGELCFGDEAPSNYVRLSFGVLNPKDLAEAGRRFITVVREFS